MGVDLYLESLWKPFIKHYQKRVLPYGPDEALMAAAECMYDDFRSSGGYFRNGYNTGDVMFAMGLSWNGTVRPMLDGSRHLPIDHARKLLTMVEERPVTKESLRSPLDVASDFEISFEAIEFLQERREQLLAILRKSIELNEPLLCSLTVGQRGVINRPGGIPIEELVDLTYDDPNEREADGEMIDERTKFDKLIERAALIHSGSEDQINALQVLEEADMVPFHMAMKFAEGESYYSMTTDDPEQVRLSLAFARHVGATVDTIQRGGVEITDETNQGIVGIWAKKRGPFDGKVTRIVFRAPSAQ